MPDAGYDDHDEEPEEIEAYCVHCREKVIMENPTPVWTKRGTPGTRGFCETCGGTIFRMGRTEAHRRMVAPNVSQFRDISASHSRGSQGRYATFINFTNGDASLANRLAEDLGKMGISTWVDPDLSDEKIAWASGVHPALDDCNQMVVVLSPAALQNDSVEQNWQFFRSQRKPVVVALAAPCEVPDPLRRAPRFDFTGEDYKAAFREMVQSLAASGG